MGHLLVFPMLYFSLISPSPYFSCRGTEHSGGTGLGGGEGGEGRGGTCLPSPFPHLFLTLGGRNTHLSPSLLFYILPNTLPLPYLLSIPFPSLFPLPLEGGGGGGTVSIDSPFLLPFPLAHTHIHTFSLPLPSYMPLHTHTLPLLLHALFCLFSHSPSPLLLSPLLSHLIYFYTHTYRWWWRRMEVGTGLRLFSSLPLYLTPLPFSVT